MWNDKPDISGENKQKRLVDGAHALRAWTYRVHGRRGSRTFLSGEGREHETLLLVGGR